MTYIPGWLQETIAAEVDETGEISDSSKEAVAAEVDRDLAQEIDAATAAIDELFPDL